MKAIIHVNQQTIRQNIKRNEYNPAIIVRTYKGVKHVRKVEITGTVQVIQTKEPKHCRARVWIECDSNQLIFKE